MANGWYDKIVRGWTLRDRDDENELPFFFFGLQPQFLLSVLIELVGEEVPFSVSDVRKVGPAVPSGVRKLRNLHRDPSRYLAVADATQNERNASVAGLRAYAQGFAALCQDACNRVKNYLKWSLGLWVPGRNGRLVDLRERQLVQL